MKEKLIIVLIILAVLFILTILYSRFIGTGGLYIKEYPIKIPRINNHLHGLKIVHLSDIHFGNLINEARMLHLVDKVNKLEPDLIVLTGDLFCQDLNQEEQTILSNTLKKMNAKLGKYAIVGNHDIIFDYWEEVIKNGNFVDLNNRFELIYYQANQPLILQGMSSNLNGKLTPTQKIADLELFIDEHPEFADAYKILLMHEPDYVDEFNSKNFNLILAGHSHNGQVRIPFMRPLFLPKGAKKYYKPYYRLDNTDLYISSGVGNSILSLRLFNRPSFNFYRLMQ